MKHNKLILTIFITLLTLTSCSQLFQAKLPMSTESSASLGTLLETKEEIANGYRIKFFTWVYVSR